MDNQDFGLKGLLDTHDAIHDMYSQQVKGMLPQNHTTQPESNQKYQQVSSPVETGADAAGLLETGYRMYKDYKDPNTNGIDTAIAMAKDATKGMGMMEAGALASRLIPGAGLALTAADLGYEGIKAGANYLQHNLHFKGLLR